VRRLVIVTLAAVVAVPGAWGAWWLWRATHPVLPDDTVAGWLPAVVVAAGNHGELSEPFGVDVAADGTIFLADAGDAHAIRRLVPGGTMQLVAGGRRGFADGVGADAAFDTPSHLALDERGNIYVADTGNHAIRRVTPDGTVTTVAGDGIPGAGEGPSARLNGPVGVAVDRVGRVVVADTYNDRIVRLDREGVVTIAGAGIPGLVDGPAAAAAFDTPAGVAVLEDGSIAVADTGNDALRRIGLDGAVTTLDAVDSSPFNTALWRPIGIVAASGGRLYVTDHRSRVLELAGGRRRVLAGGDPRFAAGLGTAAAFREPAGIAVSRSGRVVVADAGNALLRVLDLPERLGGWLPAPPRRHPGFDLERFARAPLVWPVEPQDGPHEVAGTLGEPRGNPGGDGRERFHAGVDVRAVQGATVLAVRDGVIRAVLPAGAVGTLSEFITIGPLTYIHLRVGRDRAERAIANWADVLPDPISGKPARVRVRRGTHIAAGEAIGSVNRFQHVHLNVGPPGEEANALLVGFPNVVDTVPPVIAPKGITLTDLTGTPLTEHAGPRLVVRGPVHIVVDAYDRMNDSPPRRRLGLYRAGYQVLNADGSPVPGFTSPRLSIAFDRLPPAADAPPTLYAPGSGIPFYGTRLTRYRYVLTTRVDQGTVVAEPWTPDLPPGNYLVRVLAEDAAGNLAVDRRDLPVVIPPVL
jgi:sugar lactone lactonase YvrE